MVPDEQLRLPSIHSSGPVHYIDHAESHHPMDSAQMIEAMLEGSAIPAHISSTSAGNLDAQAEERHMRAGVYTGIFDIRGGFAVGQVTSESLDRSAGHITIVDQFNRVVGEDPAGTRLTSFNSSIEPTQFRIELADACFSGHELKLTALADGEPFATSTCKLSVMGTLEVLCDTRCTGWLFAPDAPGRSFELEIWRNGVRTTSVRTELDRADVSAVFANAINPGFDTPLPQSDSPETELVSVSIRLRGCTTDLFDGPYILGTRAAAVSAARAVARHSLSNSTGMLEIEGAVLRAAMTDFLKALRREHPFLMRKAPLRPTNVLAGARINIVIPVYRDVDVTRACIESVLAYRHATTDRVILINDCSPDIGMQSLLESFSTKPNVFVMNNGSNIGFVGSVNRAMSFCTDGDVLLLNSDTELFSGVLDELIRVAASASDIGTVTAISNNATIFSYPHVTSRVSTLEDADWSAVAAIALAQNSGMAIDVPTGHGFCLLLKRELLTSLGQFDSAFGRGYGEENDFCARAADLGFRNVAAGGAFVLHRESVSFGNNEKSNQLAANLPILQSRYPEYTPLIMEYERTDPLRRARWAIDIQRLATAGGSGRGLALVVGNHLGGGTAHAIRELDEFVCAESRARISLECREDGYMEVRGERPLIRALFAPGEDDALFSLLSAAGFDFVVVHHVLGFSRATIERLGQWVRGYESVFYAHDFYSLCPRVTLVDAVGHFCNVASPTVCERCIAYGGAHMSAHPSMRSAAVHRGLFSRFLSGFRHVITPSTSASTYLKKGFPQLHLKVIPHPETRVEFPAAARVGTDNDILLLGAINADKGSIKLLELARRAQIVAPDLQFRVVGYTDIDRQLKAVGNIIITGRYSPDELEGLMAGAPGRLALFLHGWPETYSYTLSEVVRFGFIPLVPDIGAPAERVRVSGFGLVFSFPINVDEVLTLIHNITTAKIQPWRKGASPRNYVSPQASLADTQRMFTQPTRIFA